MTHAGQNSSLGLRVWWRSWQTTPRSTLPWTRNPETISMTAFLLCSLQVRDGCISLGGINSLLMQKEDVYWFWTASCHLPQRNWPAVWKERLRDGSAGKLWMSAHTSLTRPESEFCALDVPGNTALYCFSQCVHIRKVWNEPFKMYNIASFLKNTCFSDPWNATISRIYLLISFVYLQVMQRWRSGSSLPHNRQLQNLPQRGAQEFWNKSRGRLEDLWQMSCTCRPNDVFNVK